MELVEGILCWNHVQNITIPLYDETKSKHGTIKSRVLNNIQYEATVVRTLLVMLMLNTIHGF
jgi:hypothetical protein